MTIAFNDVPDGVRVPFIFVEFDTSKAQQGPSWKEYKMLVVGQRLTGGTKPALSLEIITTESQAREFYGAGSMLHEMVKKILASNFSCIDGGCV